MYIPHTKSDKEEMLTLAGRRKGAVRPGLMLLLPGGKFNAAA